MILKKFLKEIQYIMTNNSKSGSFPQFETPPHPKTGENSDQRDTNVSQSPIEALTSQAQVIPSESISTNQTNPEQSLKEVKSLPRSNLTRKILIIVIVLLVITSLSLLGIWFMMSRNKEGQDKKGEIVWWGFQHEAEIYQPLIDKYQQEHPGIKIIYKKQSPKDYRDRLVGKFAAGIGPDIFEIHNSWPAMFSEDLALLPSSIMGGDEFNKSFYPVVVSNVTNSKGIIAMPLEFDAITLYINEDIFASAVKQPPKTWDDLKILADPKEDGGFTIKGEKKVIIQSGAALGETANIDHWPEILALMMYQNRVNPAKPTGASMTDVVTFYNLFRKNGVWNDTLPNSTTVFARGTLAMYFGPTSRASEIARLNSDLKFKTVPLPQLPKVRSTDPDYSYATYWVNAVWDKSKDKNEAWEFLKYMAQNETLVRINENIKKYESVERLYPRPEMNIVFREHKVLASVASLALDAKSWYLADNTYDGLTGINTKLKDAFAVTLAGGGGESSLSKLSGQVKEALNSFSIPLK
ncbi:hypothetical protein A2863_01045 [Candidatus Woesebacteria bacterium RIFCSPHIGHO2_01_FULL_38_9b]|uniref:ABC transporter substrate-binding protein n=1 Tax=Candidatus Woesebacteria bacterium RIFCSPHIGHO2_01_FULL_38_9b TaxID=1802493 RepID=A0A1F7Y1U6_9BACT|nr:MAG: hypothetical protein A2863_01045 [Candidatus Woesebacteria bacterium RIFCSPHIGHO2_01_FULL_38_9b]